MNIVILHNKPNDITPSIELYKEAYYELEELQVRDYNEYITHCLTYVNSLERTEILYLDNGSVVAGLIVGEDYDLHVGRCLTVTFNYTHPLYRGFNLGSKLFREAMRLARQEGYPILAWTHRKGGFTYETKYRKVNHG